MLLNGSTVRRTSGGVFEETPAEDANEDADAADDGDDGTDTDAGGAFAFGGAPGDAGATIGEAGCGG